MSLQSGQGEEEQICTDYFTKDTRLAPCNRLPVGIKPTANQDNPQEGVIVIGGQSHANF